MTQGDKYFLERKLLLGSAIFLLLFSIGNDNVCKRTRKKVVRVIKKELAIIRTTSGMSRAEYLKLVTDSSILIQNAQSKMVIKSTKGVPMSHVDPGKMLTIMSDAIPDLFFTLNIDKSDISEMNKCYETTMLGFPTLMFVNRLLEEIDNYIKDLDNKSIVA